MSSYGRMLRTPRWLLRTGLAVLAIALCGLLSYWQYVRTQDQVTVAEAAVSQLAPYEAVLPAANQPTEVPVEALGRHVRVTGTVLPGARSYVRARTSPDGQPGYLVVDGIVLTDGRVVAVVQGWVPRPGAAPELADQSVRIDGRVQPDENFYPAAPITAAEPLLTITRAGLQEQWRDVLVDRELTPGYVVVTSAPADSAFQPVPPVIGSDPDVAFPWQNAFYTAQWLIFAGIVVLIWFRWLREEVADAARDEEAPAPPADRVSL